MSACRENPEEEGTRPEEGPVGKLTQSNSLPPRACSGTNEIRDFHGLGWRVTDQSDFIVESSSVVPERNHIGAPIPLGRNDRSSERATLSDATRPQSPTWNPLPLPIGITGGRGLPGSLPGPRLPGNPGREGEGGAPCATATTSLGGKLGIRRWWFHWIHQRPFSWESRSGN